LFFSRLPILWQYWCCALVGHTDNLPRWQQQRRQMPLKHGASVNANAIGRDERFVENGMTKNHRLTEIVVAVQELLPYPQAPLGGLLAEVDSRLQAGVHIDGVSVLPP